MRTTLFALIFIAGCGSDANDAGVTARDLAAVVAPDGAAPDANVDAAAAPDANVDAAALSDAGCPDAGCSDAARKD